MQLKPEQLRQHLEQQCLPAYVLHGDEPLLLQECADLIRQAARRAGCTERELLEVDDDFDWGQLLASAAEMSLFGDRKLVEVRLPSGKPGAAGSKALCEYLERDTGDILLLLCGKVDQQSLNSKWYKALDKAGAGIRVWPVGPRELPRWLRQRLKAAGLDIDNDALELLAERLEGNLYAAVQEVEKLVLLAEGGRVTLDTVTGAVLDNARYNLFAMLDTALRGEAEAALRMLRGLQGEGTDSVPILWVLARELRTLYTMQRECESGNPLPQVLNRHRVWKSRMAATQAALERHDSHALAHLLRQAQQVDASIKGFAPGHPWDRLEALLLATAGVPLPTGATAQA